MMSRLASMFLLAALGSSPIGHAVAETPPVQAQECRVALRADVPATIANRHLAVAAVVEGKPAWFRIDTAYDGTASLSRGAAQRLGLAMSGQHRTIMTLGGKLDVARATAELFAIPGLPPRRVEIDVFPADLEPTAGKPTDGQIGLGYLGDFDMEIDPAASRMRLYAVRGCGDRLVPFDEAYTSLPLKRSVGRSLVVPVTANGQEMLALLDTGANTSLIARDAALRAGVTPAELSGDKQLPYRVTGDGANHACPLHCFRQLEIGEYVQRDVYIPVMNALPAGMDMALGADFLGHAFHLLPR